eukprot:jgi/Pico_ML_1/51464/g2491.t1
MQRLLQKERNTELSSVQIDAAIRALFLEAGLERLKQTFQLHGLSPVEGPSTPQRAELEHASSVYYRLPGWGSSQAPLLLQATLDPWGHPMPEEFALHLPSAHVLLHRMAVESAIYSDEHHDCSNSSNKAGAIQAKWIPQDPRSCDAAPPAFV